MRGCVRLRSSRKTFNRERRVHRSAWADDRFALDRSLVLLVSDYKTWRAVESRVAAVEAAYGCAAVAKTFNRVRLVHRSAWGYDRFALDRSLVLLVSDYKTWRTGENCVALSSVRGCVRLRSSRKNIQPSAIGTPQCLGLRPLRARSQPRVTRQRLQSVESRGEPCSRCRACEAAYGCAAVVKPFNRVRRVHRSAWGYDRFALDRSLVLLVSDYITWRAVESRVAAVERARLRTAAQQS